MMQFHCGMRKVLPEQEMVKALSNRFDGKETAKGWECLCCKAGAKADPLIA